MAAVLAISSAEEIVGALAEASANVMAKVEGLGEKLRLHRSIHRKLRLDEIEEVLGSNTFTG